MGKSFVRDAVAEVARTLKPGGDFVFDVSFPNARNPPNFLPRLKPERFRPPHFMKFWTRGEVEALLLESGPRREGGRRSGSSPATARSCRSASARDRCRSRAA